MSEEAAEGTEPGSMADLRASLATVISDPALLTLAVVEVDAWLDRADTAQGGL